MTKPTLALVLAGGAALLMLPGAIAWACSCPSYVSEERVYRISSITRLEGEGAVPDTEAPRWAGDLTVTGTGLGDGGLQLHLWNEVSDEAVRNVWIDTLLQQEPADTGPADEGGAR